MTNEFKHYDGCKGDVDNCSACALTDERQDTPNYAAWPLAYMENNRPIPFKWRDAFKAELAYTDNLLYVENIKRTMKRCEMCGPLFSDGKGL